MTTHLHSAIVVVVCSVCVYVCMCMCMCMCVCVFVRLLVSVYVCMCGVCVWMGTHVCVCIHEGTDTLKVTCAYPEGVPSVWDICHRQPAPAITATTTQGVCMHVCYV